MKTHLSSTFGNNLADKSQQFQLETQYGHTIQLLVNQQTQQPIIVLKNKRGEIISQAQFDIQLNTKRLQSVEIQQVAYDSETKKLLFIFADESTAQASIQALWDQLEQTVIGQLALLKNILTGQHADLSNQASTYSQSLLNQVTASNERSTTLIKQDLAQRAAAIAETLALLADTQSQNHQGTLSTLNQNTSQLLNKLAALDRQLAATKTQEGQNAQSLTSALQTISAAIGLINELLATAVIERKELKDLIDGKSGEILSKAQAISQTTSSLTNKIGSAADTIDVETVFGKIAELRSQLATSQSDLDASLTGELAGRLGFEGDTDNAKAAIQAAVGKLGLSENQTVSGLIDKVVTSLQGGKQGQTKQTLSSLSGDLSNFDKRLEFIVTMLANKPTLSIEGTVPTYYLVGTNTSIPVQAKSSRVLKDDEKLTVSLKSSSGTAEAGSTTTPGSVSYTTATTDAANLTITATLTKTNPYDATQNFVIATAAKTVYRAYKVYYGYAAGTETDPAPDSVDGLTGKDVYSTYGTCDIPANPSVGGKYLYIFVPTGFGSKAAELQVSSSGFTYNWRSTAGDIEGYYAYKSTNALNSHDKISLIQ